MKNKIGEIAVASFLGVAIIAVGTVSWLYVQQGKAAPERFKSEEKNIEVSEGTQSINYSAELPGFVVYTRNYSDVQEDFYVDDDYIIPFSNVRYLANSDLVNFDLTALRYAKNEIYARHGRKFKDEGLQSYFENTSWYVPLYEPDEFPEELLSEIEKENALFLGSYEN